VGSQRTVLMPSWLPDPGLPGVRVARWDGCGEGPVSRLPDQLTLDLVEFLVLPYMGPLSDVDLTARMPRLQVVQTLTAGVDGIGERLPPGVALHSAAGVHDASTAELAVGLMIAAERGIDVAARDTVVGRWRHERRRSLADSTVVVVGWGGVGRAIGRRLAGFDVRLVAVARTARDGVLAAAELDSAVGTADIVVLALPLAADTRGILDARRLALLPDNCLVVNVSRGPVVDTEALMAELSAGRLRAALDVTDPEPLPPEHPLWRLPGVLITPHIGGDSAAFPPRAEALVAAQLRRWCDGEALLGAVPATPRADP
jgi:phosphoglycerate dehydrogenase-like enzyme